MRVVDALGFVTAFAVYGAQPATPEAYFGHRMGADRSTLEWAKVVSYYRELEKGSERIRVKEFGKSTEGRPMIVGVFSAPENLRRLERLEAIQQKLANPRITPWEEAQKLIAEGRTVVLITCSIHSTEVGSTHTAVEYAHKLATASTPNVKSILDNVVVLLAPSINPDGQDIVTNWYRKTLGTPYEGTSPPELYHKYTGHDNNRDWYIFSQAETRAVVSQLHNVWRPQIVYDVHQQGPTASRMFFPPWLDPIDPNVDPVIAQQANMIGMTMASDLTATGRKGVVVNAIYDFWTPARHYQSYHGGMRILSESASARIATPVNIKAEQIASSALGYNPRERSWNYPEPWLGGDWKLRDIVDDQLVAFDSLLGLAARKREDLLTNFYRANQRAAERRAPYAFVLPVQQADPGAAKKLLETLSFGSVEIERTREAFMAGAKRYPAGTYVVRMQQPYSGFAKTLLERQAYPDLRQYPGGPPRRPYDVTAHTLPMLMGVAVDTLDDQFVGTFDKTTSFDGFRGGALAQGWLAAADSEAWRRVNQAWRAGRPVWRDPRNGNFYLGAAQPVGSQELRKPKVGLFRGHVPSMDEGWTRWMLENFRWEFQSVGNAQLRSSNLRELFDVIVFPDQSATTIRDGYRSGSMPDEFVGGLGKEGADSLRKFAEAGGKLVFLNSSAEYAIEQLGVKAKNVLQNVSIRDFYCPGSLLNVRLASGNPLGFGLPAEFTIWHESSPAFELEAGETSQNPIRYPDSGILASGWLMGEKFLSGRTALADLPIGRGHVILFGMRPQYRAQSYLTLKLLFNSLVL